MTLLKNLFPTLPFGEKYFSLYSRCWFPIALVLITSNKICANALRFRSLEMAMQAQLSCSFGSYLWQRWFSLQGRSETNTHSRRKRFVFFYNKDPIRILELFLFILARFRVLIFNEWFKQKIMESIFIFLVLLTQAIQASILSFHLSKRVQNPLSSCAIPIQAPASSDQIVKDLSIKVLSLHFTFRQLILHCPF